MIHKTHDKDAQEAGAEKEPIRLNFGGAYVNPKDRVLDPTLLDQKLVDRLPQPTGWRILVMPFTGRVATPGGLLLPDQFREREALSTVVAYVLKVGPLAFNDPARFGPPQADGRPRPWCEPGQWVCIARYAGSRFRIEGGEVRIVNDDEIIATILDPEDIHNV